VRYTLEMPYRDGTTHVVFEALPAGALTRLFSGLPTEFTGSGQAGVVESW